MRPATRTGIAIAMAMPLASCADDTSSPLDPSSGDGVTTTTAVETQAHGTDESGLGSTSGSDDTTGTTEGGTTGTTTQADTTGDTIQDDTTSGVEPPPPGHLPYAQDFEGPDGAPWPEPWEEAGNQVISSELVDGRGRFDGQTHNVARMVLPGYSETNVDAVVTVVFDDWDEQGFGLYVRQNGGALQQTHPPGQGYAAYVEGGFMGLLGIWREIDGVEVPIVDVMVPGGQVDSGEPYRLRLQCFTEGDATRLRTRLWPADEPEPQEWHVEVVDDTPELQGTAGSFAVDLYNYEGTGSVYVDDFYVQAFHGP